MHFFRLLALLAFISLAGFRLRAAERFPPPDFTSPKLPTLTTPHPRQDIYEYIDVLVLAAALGAASYLALKKRSRTGIYVLTVFSLVYFGFYRQGCVCPIGSIQNVTLTVVDSAYVIPLTVVAFFALPLVFTLFFGRTFCSSVCPLGAIQELVLLKPLKVPYWLERSLGIIPFAYLGTAVLLAALKSSFLICRYDPFVGFFRLTGDTAILIFGASLLLIGLFVGRPYCRFLCPYGALLGLFSRISKHHVTITPDRVQEVLDPLPVERIFGVGKVTARRLHGLGIDTIRALREAPIELLVREFGKYGRVLYHLARGEDDTPVRPEREAKSVSREVTFPHDVYEREEIERIVRRMAREVAGQLRRDGLLGKTVRIKVRFPDFRTITRQARMEAPTDSTYLIEETAIGLLRRRVELSGEGVRLLGVGVGNLTAGKARQLPLFTTDEALDRTIDRLQNTFGARAVQRDGHPSPVNGKETVAGKGGSGYPESGGEAE